MSTKDFHVTADMVTALLELNDLDIDQDFEALSDTYGCLAVEHGADARTDLLTFDLAALIAKHAEIDPHGFRTALLRQVIADLEPKTRHFPTRSITFWNNVGSAE